MGDSSAGPSSSVGSPQEAQRLHPTGLQRALSILGANYHLIRSIYRHRRNEYNSMPLNIAVTAPNWAWAQHTSQDASSYLVMRNQSVNLEQACVTHALLPPLYLGPHHARDRNIRRIKNLAWRHEVMFYYRHVVANSTRIAAFGSRSPRGVSKRRAMNTIHVFITSKSILIV